MRDSLLGVKKNILSFSIALCLLPCSLAYADVQQPFSVASPKITTGNTNGFLPDKPYFEYYYDGNTGTVKNGAERNPIPWVGSSRKVYQTSKWYTDLSFAALDRPAANLFDDFRTAESPLNIRVIDGLLHDNPGNSGNQHVIAFPGLWVTAPKKPYMSVIAKPSAQNIQTDFHAYVLQSDSTLDLAFAVPEEMAKNTNEYHLTREVLADKTDELTFTTRWRVTKAGAADASMTAPIVRGAPYVTMLYDNMPFSLNGLNVLAVSADNGPAHFLLDEVGHSYTGKRFKFVVAATNDNYGCNKNGVSHDAGGNVTCQPLYSVYMLYTSKPVTLTFKPTTPAQPIETISDTTPFTGVARIAYAGSLAKATTDNPKDVSLKIADGQGGDFSKQIAVLDKYANVYPIGADINIDTSGDNKASVKFHFKTAAFDNGNANQDLLMTAYEATQLANMSVAPSDASQYTVDTVRGLMRGVLGQDWVQTINLPLSTTENALWYGNRPINPAYQTVLKEALDKDLQLLDKNTQEPGNSLTLADVTSDSYAFGKKIARLARLALIADEIGEKDKAQMIVKNYMEPYMNAWLTPASPNPDKHGLRQGYFKYDDKFGGVITARSSVRPEECADEPNGLVQCGAYLDFYNGMYTDHHFHYGYFLYAAAVMAKVDPTWKQVYQPYVDLLARDIANPSNEDPYFPTYRHFDWFEGHGYANGVGPNASGRDQESSSEAVNAWYGLALWGDVTGRSDMKSVGKVLTAMEIQAAKAWTQIIPGKSVYDDFSIVSQDTLHNPFGADVSMSTSGATGITWATKVDHSTFFGNKLGYVLGIEMLPYTPITTELFSKEWVDGNKDGALKQAISALNQQVSVYADINRAVNVFGQDTASPFWMAFQSVPNGGYQWGTIVSPIQSLDGSSGASLFDAIFNTGYPQAMQAINNNLAMAGLLGTQGSVKIDCLPNVFFKADSCHFKIGNINIPYAVPFAFGDYRGLDNGMSYSNILWWLAKTDRTTQTPLTWKQLSIKALTTTVNKNAIKVDWQTTETDKNAVIEQYIVNLLQYNSSTQTYSVAKTTTLNSKQVGGGTHPVSFTFTDVAKGKYGVIVIAKDSNNVQTTTFTAQQITVDGGEVPPPPSGDSYTVTPALANTKSPSVTFVDPNKGETTAPLTRDVSFTAKDSFTVKGDFAAGDKTIHINCQVSMSNKDAGQWPKKPLGETNSCDGVATSLDAANNKYYLWLP